MEDASPPGRPRQRLAPLWGLIIAVALIATVESVLRYVNRPIAEGLPPNPFSTIYQAHLVRWTALRPGSRTSAPVALGTAYERMWAPSSRTHKVAIGDQGLRLTGPSWRQPVAGAARATYRILVIGDSAAFGFFVEDHEAYAALLPGIALERGASIGVDAVNAGVPGYSVAQGTLYLDELLEDYEPDVVVVAFGTNDARPATTRWPERYGTHADRELLANLEITRSLLDTTGVDPWTIVDAVPAGGEPTSRLTKTAVYQALRSPLLRIRERVSGNEGEPDPLHLRVPASEFETWISACVGRIRKHNADPILVAGTVTPSYRAAIHRVHEELRTGLIDAPAVFHSAHAARLADPGGPLAPWKAWLEDHLEQTALRDHPWLLTSIDRVHPGPAGHALLAHAVISVAAGESGPGFASGSDLAKPLPVHAPEPMLALLEVRILEAVGQRSAAIDSLDRILLTRPDRPALYRLKGWLEWRNGDYMAAARSWTKAREFGLDDCESALGTVHALLLAGQVDRAVEEGLGARQRCGTDPRLGLAIGLAQFERGYNELSIPYLEEGLRAFSRSTESRLTLGHAYLASGEVDKGIKTLQKLVHAAPRNWAAKEAIAAIPTNRDPDGVFKHEAGLAWLFDVHPDIPRPPLHELSTVKLLENGVPLPRPFSHHQEIRDAGGGQFSHWGDVVFFSTTDGTDPNTNGRTYRLVSESPTP